MTSISKMPPHSKVWVYQSNRPFTASEAEIIISSGNNFIAEWAAHGASLKASFDIIYNQFIVIAVDEQQALASGCSIDKSVKFIKETEQQFNLNLFDRLQVAYRKADEIAVCSLSAFEKLAEQGLVTETTVVFNNMITTKSAFDTKWEVPLKQSWQSRVLV
jgi:hypothetical protein